jgi:hypothetical protein
MVGWGLSSSAKVYGGSGAISRMSRGGRGEVPSIVRFMQLPTGPEGQRPLSLSGLNGTAAYDEYMSFVIQRP